MLSRRNIIIFIVLFIVIYCLFFLFSFHHKEKDESLMSDVGRLVPIKVKEVVKGLEVEEMKNLLQEAKEQNLKVSIAGKQHSQGGHTYYKDGIVLDMTTYNKVIKVDPEEKLITVQSGATWADVQETINPYGLCIKTMQAPNIFTIGGSMSVNVHGRDIRFGPLIESILSFRLMNANGDILNVSRTENEELFRLVNGGYGLFGIILDVDIELTDDVLYKVSNEWIDYHDYPEYFKEKVLNYRDVEMHNARISVAPKSFLTEMYVTNYSLTDEKKLEDYTDLVDEKYVRRNKFAFGLSRNSDWGKNFVWFVQKHAFKEGKEKFISRNNVMRPEVEFLNYEGKNDTDILQEYFVPVDDFPEYVDRLREILTENDLNVLNITVRHVPKNEEAFLSYAKEDMFALVFYINQGISAKEIEKTGEVIRKIIDLTLEMGGSYYLPYYHYPTKEQMREAYPLTDEFFQKKKEYDPDERFMNQFYEEYGK
ncbi:FAD-binding oxidoreductase [Bacillus sp. FJAT-49732]|uniref:FAD-binding oxidoreductase n=1 Tax=Lederbergia citrisecunda TaxID=2833583 RepID=A0A942TIK1_9BACI|nr:FAD-binding oxidoreductase [Lederbergia citrisecunda]MBS4198295.1 FAD-binding oxidoreductase [Lederbergia citrisecunda]